MSDFRRLVVVGDPDSVRRQLLAKATECEASELMVVCNVHSHAARLRCYELVAQALAD